MKIGVIFTLALAATTLAVAGEKSRELGSNKLTLEVYVHIPEGKDQASIGQVTCRGEYGRRGSCQNMVAHFDFFDAEGHPLSSQQADVDFRFGAPSQRLRADSPRGGASVTATLRTSGGQVLLEVSERMATQTAAR